MPGCFNVQSLSLEPSYREGDRDAGVSSSFTDSITYGRKFVTIIYESSENLIHYIYDSLNSIYIVMKKWIEEISVVSRAVSATVGAFCGFGAIQIKQLTTPEEFFAYKSRVAELEGKASYPLGPNERFKIDHGDDYFAFFRRMGELHYFVALDGERVVGVGAGILRDIPFTEGAAPQKSWYLCDLKVDPEYRGTFIPMQMFKSAAWNAFKCTRGYAISMNPPSGQNRIVKMFNDHGWIPISPPKQLGIFSFDKQQVEAHRSIIEHHRGPMSYLSLKGKKDLILESTKAPLPLLHVQFDRIAGSEPLLVEAPEEGHTHMFCALQDSLLSQELGRHGVEPVATASILSRGMETTDWSFVLTSDI